MKTRIPLGLAVVLKPFPENDVPEEKGCIVHLSFDPAPIEYIELDLDDPNQMVTVEVLNEYREGPEDDGLRECSVDQIEWPESVRKNQ